MTKEHYNSDAIRRRKFKYSMLAAAVMSVTSMQSFAEEAATEEDENVVVITGQRGNLISAERIKRDADTVVDALSAEDISSLADRSVLEAISRIPGVSMERFIANNDPDHFGVEGGGLVVRGLTFVRSEFNGRDSFTAGPGRGLSFQDVSPELLGSVEVYKNQTASTIEGGIGGVVNLNTRKPFDRDGQLFAFSADVTRGDLRDEKTPSYSGLYSNVWNVDSGRFGFLVSAARSDIEARNDAVQIGRYVEQGTTGVFVPNSIRVSKKKDDQERKNFATSLQWESSDNTLMVTAEYITNSTNKAWGENSIESTESQDSFDGTTGALIQGTARNNSPVAGTEFETDSNGFFESGAIVNFAGWRGDAPGGRYGLGHQLVTRYRDNHTELDDTSINIQFVPNDRWAFQFDAQRIVADSSAIDMSLMGGTWAVPDLNLNNGGLPEINLRGPGFDGQANYISGTPFTDPSLTFWRAAMDHTEEHDADETALRFDVEYTFESGFARSVEFGVRYTEQDRTTRNSTFNWGNLSEAWTFPGQRNFFNEAGAPFEEVSFDDFFRGGVLNMEGGNAMLFAPLLLAQDYANIASNLAATRPDGSWVPLAQRTGAVGNYLPGEINTTKEESTALYTQLNFETSVSGMELTGNIGFRYIDRDTDTVGSTLFPFIAPAADPGNTSNPRNFLTPDQEAFVVGGSVETEVSSNYKNLLPSLNLKLKLQEDLIMRFAFSEGIALPNQGDLQNFINISGSVTGIFDPTIPVGDEPVATGANLNLKAGAGNPFLKPVESYNYDLTLEWYFDEGNHITASLFYKKLNNYFVNDFVTQEFTNNGVTQLVDVKQTLNRDDGKVQGAELTYQQFFTDLPGAFGGIGVSGNFTYLDQKGSPNPGVSRTDRAIAFTGLPLEGLSDQTANGALIYEKYGISARLAYNWRSKYLLTTRDVITALPIFNDAGTQVDASVFYNLTDNWKVGVQAINLTNNITKTLMQVNQEGDLKARSFFTSDRRYSFVVRGTF